MVGSDTVKDYVQLGLGTVQWGLCYGIANRTGQPSTEQVRRMLELARKAGVSMLDTARDYGSAEDVIGDLVGGDVYWTIVTKLSPKVWGEGQTPNQVIQATYRSLEASRRALHRPCLHVVLLHRASHRTAGGGVIWDALRHERDKGRIGVLGVSAGSPEEAFSALEDSDVQALQVASSLLDQRLVRAHFFDRARACECKVFVRSVFLQGVAFKDPTALPPHLEALHQPLAHIRAWGERRGMDAAAVFLAFARNLKGATILVGCETLAQLRANLHAWQSAHRLAEAVQELAKALPPFPENVLNPARWPPIVG